MSATISVICIYPLGLPESESLQQELREPEKGWCEQNDTINPKNPSKDRIQPHSYETLNKILLEVY